jgi:hypothetical protein
VDGLSAAAKIRRHTDVPIVFISGRTDADALERASNATRARSC